MDIAIEKLVRCPIQLRSVIKEALGYISTMDSIRDLGILVPLLVRPVEDYYEVIDGNHRLEIGIDLRLPTLPCHIREFTDAQVRQVQMACHENRISPKPAEVYRRLWKIVTIDQIASLDEMATYLRWHPGKVKRVMNLVRLCPRAQKDLERGDLSMTIAMELCKLSAGLQEDFMDLAGSMPNTELKELIRKETRQERYGGRGGHTGTLDYRFRKLSEVKNEYLNPTVAASVLLALGITTTTEAFTAGVGWAMKADPLTQADDQFANAKRAAKEEARLKQRIDESLNQ